MARYHIHTPINTYPCPHRFIPHSPTPLQRLPGHTDSAPTCVAVLDEDPASTSCRLFSAGLDGRIVECDPDTLHPAAITDSYGGAVWQIVVEPVRRSSSAAAAANADRDAAAAAGRTVPGEVQEPEPPQLPHLAAACDDGRVRLFSVERGAPGASYLRALPRVEGRVLSIAWHPQGAHLASAGTDGCIHIWEVATSREVLRITAGERRGKGTACYAFIPLCLCKICWQTICCS
jgi:U3 small nucleolar RNA-associated protein 4